MKGNMAETSRTVARWPAKPHVSSVSLRAYDRCPRSWSLRYATESLRLSTEMEATTRVEARLAPGNPAALVGTVVDRTIAQAMRGWHDGGPRPYNLYPMAMEILRAIVSFSLAWTDAVESGSRWPVGEHQPLDRIWFGEGWTASEKEEIREVTYTCLKSFEAGSFLERCAEVGPSRWVLPSKGTPAWFMWPTDDGSAVPCWAAFDFILFQPGGDVLVYDFKCRDPAWSGAVAEQLAIYGAYCLLELGVPIENIRLVPFWLRTGQEEGRRLSPIVLEAVRQRIHARHVHLTARLRQANAGDGTSAFPLAQPDVCNGCPFHSCPGFARPRGEHITRSARPIPLKVEVVG